MIHLRKTLTILASLALVVLLLDQGTKALVRVMVDPGEVIEIIPGFFALVHIYNTGIAFGLFQGQSSLITVLGLLALGINLVIFWGEWKKSPAPTLDVWGMGLILGGALGNLVDRVVAGKVTDFLLFSVGSWHWPAFNLADSGITVGIVLILFAGFRLSSGQKDGERNGDTGNRPNKQDDGSEGKAD